MWPRAVHRARPSRRICVDRLLQPDGVVQSRIAMLDISALAFGLLAIAAFALAICIVIVA
jgi:hypothetical protein